MKLFSITFIYLRKLFSNKKVVILNIIVPVLFMALILAVAGKDGLNSNTLRAAVINKDKGELGQQLEKKIKAMEGISIKTVEENKVDKLLNLGELNVVIKIPEDFSTSKDKKVQLFKTAASNSDASINNSLNYMIDSIANKSGSVKVESKLITRSNVKINGATELILGLTIIVLMFSMSFIIGEIIDEKEEGTFTRVMSAPHSKISIVGGFLLSFLVFGMLQVLTIVFVSRFVFGMWWGSSYYSLTILFICFEIMIISLAIFLSGIMKSGENIMLILIALLTPTGMLGGCFFPTELFPENVRKFSYLMPQSWMFNGLKEVVVRGNGISSIVLNCVVMLLIGAVFFIAGSRVLAARLNN